MKGELYEKKKVVITLLILLTIIGISYTAYSVYMKSLWNWEGWTPIININKEKTNDKCYFYVQPDDQLIRLECDPEQYKELVIDPYSI